MISVIPALDFMRSLSGTYKEPGGQAELRIWSCGYGVAFDLRGERKTELVGVIGAFGSLIECFAQVGLPNVIRFVGDKTSKTTIQFKSEEPSLELELSREAERLSVRVSLQGVQKLAHVLQVA